MQLAQSNFIYRHPKIAEELRRPTAAARAQRWAELIHQHHPTARTVVDLGCWIGLDAEQLASQYDVVGVDIQPHLIDYARRYRRGRTSTSETSPASDSAGRSTSSCVSAIRCPTSMTRPNSTARSPRSPCTRAKAVC